MIWFLFYIYNDLGVQRFCTGVFPGKEDIYVFTYVISNVYLVLTS